MAIFNPKGLPLPAECTDNGLALTVWASKYKHAIEERDAALGRVEELEGACKRALWGLRAFFDDDEASGHLDNAEGELEKVLDESTEGGA